MADNFSQMNPLYGIYSEFKKILNTLVIKYSYLAEEKETFEIKKEADMYISCKEGIDTFFTYRDYTADELYKVGITDAAMIRKYTTDNGYLQIPSLYRNSLLQLRRKTIIENYEEKNDYYRELNGLPPLNTPKNKFHYVPKEYAELYGIDENIPIHKIQDYYNNIRSGKGDYIISVIEGLGILDTLKTKYPDEVYLKYIGTTRIPIDVARKAKNFQILYTNPTGVSSLIYEEFTRAYEQARDYHISVIFVREYRNIMPYYDRFISSCILCMTIELVLNKQFKLGIDRKYYNDYTLQFLYDAYGIPYKLDIDDFTQQSIAQSLNMLIQEKSTDSVFYHIANILGINDLKLYRYYLTKERKFDAYGVPIIEYTEKFNSDTGMIERIPDYSKMYDVYFQKVELRDTDFISSYDIVANREPYEKITSDDPFWWEDENTFKSVWDSEYNFVEAKYLSVGLSYKMTDIMYENILLLKLLMSYKEDLDTVEMTLPKINEELSVTLFDAVILLFCLMAKQHNLRGEIISIPTQVESVLEYLHNTDGGDEYLLDTFSFDLAILHPNNEKGQEMISNVSDILDADDAEKFMSYITELSINNSLLNNATKISLINKIFTDIKGLSNYIQYLMAKATDRKSYEILKEFYNTAFYTREVKSTFTINENNTELKRTAKNYFEFLYYHNPKLYSALFTPNYESQYSDYILKHELNSDEYTLDDYKYDVEYGNIDDFTYSTLNTADDNSQILNDLIYYYIDHVISRLEAHISNLKFTSIKNDATMPLEELLVKLIRFFKSFTVDMIGFDIMYIMNLRAENTMKLFDEIQSIKKEIEIKDKLYLSYSDVIHLIEATFDKNKDTLTLHDKILYDAYLHIIKDSEGNNFNDIDFSDLIQHIESTISVASKPSDNNIKIFDTIETSSIAKLYDRSNDDKLFTDKIYYKYYTE